MRDTDYQKGKELIVRFLSFCLRTIQNIPIYKILARLLRPQIVVAEADDNDLKVLGWYEPNDENIPEGYPTEDTSIVAKRGQDIVGYLQVVWPNEDHHNNEAWIYSLHVKIPYRRMGIARLLLTEAINRANQKGISEIALNVLAKNSRAIKFYSNFGYNKRELSDLEKQSGAKSVDSGFRRIVMHKRLM